MHNVESHAFHFILGDKDKKIVLCLHVQTEAVQGTNYPCPRF
jgi:hypothetical protein